MSDPYREPVSEIPQAAPKPEAFPGASETGSEIAPAEKKPEAPAPAKEAVFQMPVSASAAAPVSRNNSGGLAKDLDQDRQLKILVEMAFAEGIDKAVEAARAAGNAYMIDKLHDTLVDELSEKLKTEGKLKEI